MADEALTIFVKKERLRRPEKWTERCESRCSRVAVQSLKFSLVASGTSNHLVCQPKQTAPDKLLGVM